MFLPAICLAIQRGVWKMHAALHTIHELKSLEEDVLVTEGKLGKACVPLPSCLGRGSSVYAAAFIPGPKLVGARLSGCFPL